MTTNIDLAGNSPGVDADGQTDADGAERRRRICAYHTLLTTGDGVRDDSCAIGSVKPLVAETAAATLIRADRRPWWYEKGTRDDAVDQVEGPDERVIWSPFKRQRRRRDRERLAAADVTNRDR